MHRSRRRGFYERLVLRWRGHRPYRCYQCGHRFYDDANAPHSRQVTQTK